MNESLSIHLPSKHKTVHYNICITSAQRLWRCSNIVQMVYKCFCVCWVGPASVLGVHISRTQIGPRFYMIYSKKFGQISNAINKLLKHPIANALLRNISFCSIHDNAFSKKKHFFMSSTVSVLGWNSYSVCYNMTIDTVMNSTSLSLCF